MTEYVTTLTTTREDKEYEVIRSVDGPRVSRLREHTLHLTGYGVEVTMLDFKALPFDPNRPITVTFTQEDTNP